MTRFRITIRGEGIELRGYVDGDMSELEMLAGFAAPWQVLASLAPDDFDPFRISEPDYPPTIETSRELVRSIMGSDEDAASVMETFAVLHFQQANVIRGERHRAEVAERYTQDIVTRAMNAIDHTTLGGSDFAQAIRDSAKQALRQVLADLHAEAGPRRG